jgi:hypothetical protein
MREPAPFLNRLSGQILFSSCVQLCPLFSARKAHDQTITSRAGASANEDCQLQSLPNTNKE